MQAYSKSWSLTFVLVCLAELVAFKLLPLPLFPYAVKLLQGSNHFLYSLDTCRAFSFTFCKITVCAVDKQKIDLTQQYPQKHYLFTPANLVYSINTDRRFLYHGTSHLENNGCVLQKKKEGDRLYLSVIKSSSFFHCYVYFVLL